MSEEVIKTRKSEKYNWFQISNILRLTSLNREVVKIKYSEELLTEEEWKKKLKKDEINF